MTITPERFTEKLKTAHGDNLLSVVLFGSAASGEYTRKYSDFNLLVVLKSLRVDDLNKAAPIVIPWVKSGNPPPLFFTLDRLKRSQDVFPIEFLDMRDRHKVLYGPDPLENLAIDESNLRLELEHELKGKMIKLREDYLLTGGKIPAVRDLVARAGSTFEILFLGVLRLHGVSPLPKKSEAAKAISGHAMVWDGVFDYIKKIRNRDKAALKEDPVPYFDQLLRAVEAVADHVDQWGDSASHGGQG